MVRQFAPVELGVPHACPRKGRCLRFLVSMDFTDVWTIRIVVKSAFPIRARWWTGMALFLACPALCHAARYSFKHYLQDSGLTNLAVNTINQDRDGFLWVATDNGLFRYNGRRFRRFGRDEGLPQDDVTALTISSGGTVWAGTPGGIAYLSGLRFHPVLSSTALDSLSQGRLVAAGENAARSEE